MSFEKFNFTRNQYTELYRLLGTEDFCLDRANIFVAEIYDPQLSHWASRKIGELHVSKRNEGHFGTLYFDKESRLDKVVKQLTLEKVS